MKHIGLDAGSVSVKIVVFDAGGGRVSSEYVKHRGHPLSVAREVLGRLPQDDTYSISLTGSAGRLLAEIMKCDAINEVVAQAYATRKLHPGIRSIIEMGGEDSKLIILGDDGVRDFAMNSVCAAGTGSFLDQQGERLKLTPEEMSELALRSKRPPRVAGRCSVFAKSDMIHLQQIATPVEDIVSGLCFAVARNFKGSIARGRVLESPVAFQGGVAANRGVIRAFREVFGLEDLFVPDDYALMGAIGAALKHMDEGVAHPLNLAPLDQYLSSSKTFGAGHPPLIHEGDMFHPRHIKDSRDILHEPSGQSIPAYMGVDIGSISTNVAIIDEEGRLLSKRYLMTAGRPIEAVRQGLREVFEEIGQRVDIKGVGTTGSGRYMISDYIGADIVKNEITAQATAAAFIDPRVDTIFEIGGQDSKYIALRDGVITEFEMNKACAAGTGSFLEEQAEKLDVRIKGEFAESAFTSDCPSRLGERCTVFMENSLMANLQKGAPKNDLLAGLSYSIVQNYINRVVAGRPVGKHVFFQGGVAFNKSVVAAFEKHLGLEVTVPPNHDVTGAIGMALIAKKHMQGKAKSSFRGFEACQTPYDLSSFECKSCSNHCEINRVNVEGMDRKLFYGGRCEKYDISRTDTSHIENLFKFRDETLWSFVKPNKGGRPRIGIPYIFFFNEFLPYWATLLDELGFDAVVTPRTDRSLVDLGLQSVISEACFPVKVAIGHMRHMKEMDIEAVLNPSFINLNNGNSEGLAGLACPHTQSIPYVANVAVGGMKHLIPVIDISRGENYMARELKKAFADYGISRGRIRAAMSAAQKAQESFYSTIKQKGREALASLTGRSVVIVGRAYNAFERGMNLQIPEKLATLGVQAIPMDMLPLEGMNIGEDWPSMYWRSGQRILKAAKFVRDHPMLYPIYIGNFSCGPDSFILKFFSQELAGKPFLHIEIDEHSADAGAITRCEAFLDSIENRREEPAAPRREQALEPPDFKDRVVYVPPMADHAYAVAAAFERAGVQSRVLDPSDGLTIEHGMKYVSGKECYPCIVTTGDMVKKVLSPGFEADKSAFFMPSGSGPCRFGQYNVFHKQILDDMGISNVPVYAPNQDDGFYKDLGIVDSDFAMNSWKGIVAIELLHKSLRETRPYEVVRGQAQALYDKHLIRVYDALRGHSGDIEGALMAARDEFMALTLDRSTPRPLIGVIGELFVRTNRFSNEDLLCKIEDMGGECWMAPLEEWVYYINTMGLRKALIKRSFSAIIDSLVKRYFKHRVEHRYGRLFEGYLKRLHEPSIQELFDKAAPYVDDTFEGEAVISVGKAVDLAQKGACGVVNAMPFGCMPGTIVSALLRAVSRDYDIPCITIPYDGTASGTTELQLEAFMEQARDKMAAKLKKEVSY